ncbi:MAG TPA: WecB/TagA/CpsF family glycosyltransferase [Amnibacterium sp.]|jgi:N-acetylglucosaminyldiphosphoundecaprenol N-acetyl-beta-D-mannosaminyltransferase
MMTADHQGDLTASPDGGDLGSRWGELKRTVGGLHFVATTPDAAARQVVADAARPGRAAGEHIHLANAYSIALSSQDEMSLGSAFGGSAWNLPDGKPVGWVSAYRRQVPRLRQVRGPQFFLDVCELGEPIGLRHYLLGGTPHVLELLKSSLATRFPDIRIVGSDSPPFRTPTAAELEVRDRAIASSGAQIVWVGLGTPKQDIEAARLAGALPIVAIAIGAGFDYAAGTLRAAPAWMSAVGMEWFFRLLMEPARLWRRYLFGNLRFILAVLRDPGHARR